MSSPILKKFQDQIIQAGQSKELLRITGSGSKDWYGNALKGQTLSTKEYAGILNYQPDELVITVKSGTPLKEVEAALAEKGQQFAFEPPHFGPNATIGGMIGAGLAGPGRVSVGGLRDFVLGTKIMDGQGQMMDFGGTVMKNVAGYDVSRLMPGSLGTLALLLDVSIKVLPVAAATATVRVQIEQSKAIHLMNLLASQPWPLNASAWVGENLGTLHLRLSGAKAAVQSAISSFSKTYGMQLMAEDEARAFWTSLREQTHSWFNRTQAENLWRMALPSTAETLLIVGETLIEWHGGQRWYKSKQAAKEMKALAQALGGHASAFRSENKNETLLSSVKDNPLTAALAPVEDRLRKTFDPQGVFATGRLI
jgi:glycolate oxidase FAD binding subunit